MKTNRRILVKTVRRASGAATAVRAASSGAMSVVERCIAGGSARPAFAGRGDGAVRRPYHLKASGCTQNRL